ncbi:MAG: hypothetical protein ACREM3_31425 [Candidatus Rokuibacteriota bacterium]
MILPIVHLNGTSRDALVNLRIEACNALRAALEALAEMAPHGRDYYLVPGRMEQALKQHEQRVDAVAKVYQALTAEVEALVDEEGR